MRRLLLGAALNLIAARGLSTLSIDDITREAGLNADAFYMHFSSKTVMFVDLLVHLGNEAFAELEPICAASEDTTPWREQILTLFHTLRRHRLCMLCWTEAKLLAARDEGFRHWFTTFSQHAATRVTEALSNICALTGRKTLAPPEVVALGLMRLTEGIQLSQLAGEGGNTVLAEQLVLRFMDGMTCNDTGAQGAQRFRDL
ncbi:MAG: TetR/AcrR family transcriptional regulator [Paludibacterium sp.]|uniref:TetR/AcrR family transcriptional regulator n=1 Tax=Paludibacterium sp. TaxID=1917523 RepID=UPI0025E964E1|nr:TetR/AcrR family transcriptional regulator [Paludibacterium sp.]MBV8046848.1 TetR/AcrR family transcriptional regulator [Paludibacterium sp.]MBV8646831.1 TetR/AcrR family transcriptional regulator [Paludibacterium sp.]